MREIIIDPFTKPQEKEKKRCKEPFIYLPFTKKIKGGMGLNASYK